MKKLIFTLFALCIALSSFAQNNADKKYVFGNAVMDWESFKETLPFVNDSDVNIRKSPELLPDNKIGKFEKSDYVTVRLVTKEKEKIGKKAYPWYYIQGYDKDLSGWIYGEYISVNKDYYMDVWSPQEITIDFPKRCYYFDKLIEKSKTSFLDSEEKLIIAKDKMTIIGDTGLWYLKETCPKICDYKTEYGYARIHINEETQSWAPLDYVFTEKKYCEIIGMTLQEMKKRLGNDCWENDGKYVYSNYEEWAWWLEIEVKNNVVTKITLSFMYN